MAWEEFAVSGVTESTPTNILLGAGTLYRNFVFDAEAKKWNGAILGATSGGNKLSIVPEVLDIEADGVLVKAKGLRHKIGETATIETNMLEITGEWIKSVIIGETGVSADERFDVIESKALIEDGDYIENFAFVGFKTNGDPIVVIFDYAICTSGLEAEGKNKENSVFPATFECVADLVAGGNTNKLPYHIYTVKETQQVPSEE
ncbi:MAG: hypothetical protein HFE90_08945 [Firmicutes bacterium]|nr:hypothetical protein [Bacillota bacterium]